MSRADVLMRKIREDIAKIESQQGASTHEEIDVMELALMELTRHINALGDIPVEGVLPYKDDLIGIMALMDNLEKLIEAAKDSSRKSVLDMIQKIKAQASYTSRD
jgi:hypothetical protein